MKKILLCIFLSMTLWNIIFAQNAAYDSPAEAAEGIFGISRPICTITSEPCQIWATQATLSGSGQMARYKCCVSAQSGFIEFVAGIYKYIFFISLVFGVLLMVLIGIGISYSGFGSEEIKKIAKSRVVSILTWLVVLTMLPWILKTLAPFFFI